MGEILTTIVWAAAAMLGLIVFGSIVTAVLSAISAAGGKRTVRQTGLITVSQHENGVVFTLGKCTGTRGPGLRLLIPAIQEMEKVDRRIVVVDMPHQEVMTGDNINLSIDAAVYYEVRDPASVINIVQDHHAATVSMAQATIRDVVGTMPLDDVLKNREEIQSKAIAALGDAASQWGVHIQRVTLQQIVLPPEMRRAMAVEAEAERSRRAVVITASGELEAATNTALAAEILGKHQGAIYLRTLQALQEMAGDPAQKIVLMLPADAGRMEQAMGIIAATGDAPRSSGADTMQPAGAIDVTSIDEAVGDGPG